MALKYSQLSHNDRSSVSEGVGNEFNGAKDGSKITPSVFNSNSSHNRTMPESVLKDIVSSTTSSIAPINYSCGRVSNIDRSQRHHRGASGSSKTLPGHGHAKRNSAVDKVSAGAPTEELYSTSFSPDDLAAQLTIMDQLVFRDIVPEELTSCSWNKKNKLEVAPNVVNLTRRFNHVSFWTVDQVLRGDSPKQRAEIMAHFIRVAKRLNEMNNLHAEKAILSAMQCASLFRLNKTWSCLPRKERQVYEKLSELFSENDNFSKLRLHMDGIALKHQACVPYLGLYLTDLVYIDMAHPHSGGIESQQRQMKMNNTLRIVAELQQSQYHNLVPTADCVRYLRSIRYIDELQKFVEDDQWKRSLRLEPDENAQAHSNSNQTKLIVHKESAPIHPNLMAELNLSPAKGGGSESHNQKKFVRGHRKCRSDGASIFFACGRTSQGGSNETIPWNTNSSEILGTQQRKLLIDDSILDDSTSSPASNIHDLSGEDSSSSEKILLQVDFPRIVNKGGSSSLGSRSGNRSDSAGSRKNSWSQFANLQESGTRCVFQSMIKRKALIKAGKRLTMSGWQRYWIELWGSSLVYFSPKTLTKSNERKDYKSDPCKYHSISGWLVMVPDSTLMDSCSFQLTDPVQKSVYKFRTSSEDIAQIWIRCLQDGAQAKNFAVYNTNLISFE